MPWQTACTNLRSMEPTVVPCEEVVYCEPRTLACYSTEAYNYRTWFLKICNSYVQFTNSYVQFMGWVDCSGVGWPGAGWGGVEWGGL